MALGSIPFKLSGFTSATKASGSAGAAVGLLAATGACSAGKTRNDVDGDTDGDNS